jgi:predicted RNase H-like nuclease (RuvC/YqgF family)
LKQPQQHLPLQPVNASPQLAVAAFKKEVVKLQRKVARLEAENFSLKARIKALEKAEPARAVAIMTDEELEQQLEQFARDAGYIKQRGRS